jgi:hypothetical protein
MKNILAILALAFLVSMVTASASEITITSPVPGQKYCAWDEVPIQFTNTLGEGYTYTTYVNGVETNVFAPEKGGKYVVKVLAKNLECEDCNDKETQVEFNVDCFPQVDKTRIVITSPEIGVEYHVNDFVPIDFDTPLVGRDDFEFKTYVTGPNGVRELTDTWAPTVAGKYNIKVEAVGNGFTFTASHRYVALAPE